MLTKLALSLWAAVATTVYLIDFARWHVKFKLGTRYPFNRKPFNCEACLPVWLFAVFLFSAIYNYTVVAGIACAFTAGIIAPLIIKQISKL